MKRFRVRLTTKAYHNGYEELFVSTLMKEAKRTNINSFKNELSVDLIFKCGNGGRITDVIYRVLLKHSLVLDLQMTRLKDFWDVCVTYTDPYWVYFPTCVISIEPPMSIRQIQYTSDPSTFATWITLALRRREWK